MGRELDVMQYSTEELASEGYETARASRELFEAFPILQTLMRIRLDQHEEIESKYEKHYRQAIAEVLGADFEFGSIGSYTSVYLLHLTPRGSNEDLSQDTLDRINLAVLRIAYSDLLTEANKEN